MNFNPNIYKLAGCSRKHRTDSAPAAHNILCLGKTSPLSISRQPLRATASEFVPNLDIQDSQSTESENDHSYESDGFDYENTTSTDTPRSGVKKNRHIRPQHSPSPGCSTNTQSRACPTPQPPPELANGLPHFKGPYVPLLRHRLANADAYGLIKDAYNLNEESLLMKDLIQQLSKLGNLKDVEELTNSLDDWKPESDQEIGE